MNVLDFALTLGNNNVFKQDVMTGMYGGSLKHSDNMEEAFDKVASSYLDDVVETVLGSSKPTFKPLSDKTIDTHITALMIG